MRSVAIIGAGIGAEHAAGYAALPERFCVRTICDVDATRGRALAEHCGAMFTANLADVLESGVDIVDICLPPHLHYEVCVAALKAGKITVCEKPLVGSLAQADQLGQVLHDCGGHLFPVFQYRYGIGTAQLRALMAAGLTGRCYAGTLETHWDRDAAYYDNDWRGTWAGEQGGAILGHAIHIHDLLMWILGPVARVHAELATRVNDIEVEDCAALSLRMANGATVTSSVTLGAANNFSRLRLLFESVSVESDHAPYAPAAAPWKFTARNPEQQAQIDAVLTDVPEVMSGFAGFFAAMADALDGMPETATTFEDGHRSLEFVTAVYSSARSGAPSLLPLTMDTPLYSNWMP